MGNAISGRWLVLVAFSIISGLSAASDDLVLVDELSSTIQSRMSRDDVPGVVVAVLTQGDPIWVGAFGMADPATGRAMTEDALFRVESISKSVTAWGAMRLAESGQLDLDAPITNCLRRWRPPSATSSITARQLLSHTAGIGLGEFTARHSPSAPRPSLAEQLANEFETVASPGARFAYSDTAFNLFELVVEDCTGEDFGVLMNREVLVPLGMTEASYDWTGTEMPVGYDLRNRPVAPYVYPGRASGGLYATVADLVLFASAAFDSHDVLDAERVAEMHRPVVSVSGLFGFAAEGYGLGHFTETLSDGRAAVWHGGQGYGWMSHIHLVPDTGDGIVILSNSQRAWPLFAQILRYWSSSLSVEPVGMARVLWAEMLARFAIAAFLLIPVVAFAATRMRIRRRIPRQVVFYGFVVVLIAWPLWAMTQDYLFIFSILPGLWPWLAASSLFSGIGLLVVAKLSVRRSSRPAE